MNWHIFRFTEWLSNYTALAQSTSHIKDIQVTKWIPQPYASMHSAMMMQGDWYCQLSVQLSAKVFKLSFEYLHIYSPKSGDFCRKKNSKIASLLSCQRADLRKTLKYSQSWDLEGIQWILWIYTDAALSHWSLLRMREFGNFKTSHRVLYVNFHRTSTQPRLSNKALTDSAKQSVCQSHAGIVFNRMKLPRADN